MHDVEMRIRDLRQIQSRLDRQCLGVSRVRELPVGEGAFLFLLQLFAGRIDQYAGFAMHAGDRIRP